MASKIKVIASAVLTGLAVIAAFIVFCPKNESFAPPEHEGQTQQTAVEAPTVEPETQQAPPKMGRGDGLAGGGADDKWQTVQSGGREIFVMTNGPHSGGVFYTYIVANLPESSIVGAPQSVMNDIEGNCETRHYHVRGSLFFTGRNRSGMATESTPPEDFERQLVPNSPFKKAFDMLCTTAREKNTNNRPPNDNPPPNEAAGGTPAPPVTEFTTYTNGRFGFRIEYPRSFISKELPENGDGIGFVSPDGAASLVVAGGNNDGFTLKDYYEMSLKSVRGQLGYRKMGGSWFVITWQDSDKLGYMKMFVGNGSQNSFTFTSPESQKSEYEAVITRLEKSFSPGNLAQAR